MKTLETIYKKLNSVEKTELETHKVELGIVDDYLDSFKKLLKLDDNIDKNYSEMKKEVNKAALEIEKSEKVYQKTEKLAKELGVNINEILPNAATARINNIKKKVKSFRKL